MNTRSVLDLGMGEREETGEGEVSTEHFLGTCTLGIMEGTQIATPEGWRAVEAMAPGDHVLTFDGGPRRLISVSRDLLGGRGRPLPPGYWPLVVPAGAMGNTQPLRLLPEQTVMLESDMAEEALGDPFVLVRALALHGLAGVHREEPGQITEVLRLVFEEDQVIYAQGGGLLFCPAERDFMNALVSGGSGPYRGVDHEFEEQVAEQWAHTAAQ